MMRWPSIVTRNAHRIFSSLCYGWRFQNWGTKALIAAPDLLLNPKGISIGSGVEIRKGGRLEAIGWDSSDSKPRIQIGDGTSIHLHFHCGAAESVVIGRDVLIAGRVYISDHDHEFDHPTVPPIRSGLRTSPVVIEDEVWIGEGAAILKGVRVGKRSVIGANAVVTKDVPPFSVAVGVPAKVVRRFGPESTEQDERRDQQVSEAGEPGQRG